MLSEPDGGFTYDGERGAMVTSGFACGMSKTYPSATMSADEFLANPKKAKKMIADHLEAVARSGDPDIKVGGWHDPDSGTIFLDHVKVFPNTPTGKAGAISLAKAEGEISIAHLDKITSGDYSTGPDGAFIPTGGTGNIDQRSKLLDHDRQATRPAVRDRAHAEEAVRDVSGGDRGAGRGDVRGSSEEGQGAPPDQRELIALLERIEARHGKHNQKDHAGKKGGSALDDLDAAIAGMSPKKYRKLKKKAVAAELKRQRKLLKKSKSPVVFDDKTGAVLFKAKATWLEDLRSYDTHRADPTGREDLGGGDRRGDRGDGRGGRREPGDRAGDLRHLKGKHDQSTHGRGGGIDVSRGALGTGHRSPELGDMSDKGKALALGVVHDIPGMGGIETVEAAAAEVEARLEAVVDEALARGFTVEQAVAASTWYDVANDYANEMVTEAGLHHDETGAAVLAALSPSAAWEGNVTNARVVLDKVGKNKVVTDADIDLAVNRDISALESALGSAKSPKQVAALEAKLAQAKDPATRAAFAERMKGKRFNDLDESDQVAVVNGTVQGLKMKGTKLVPKGDGSYSVEEDANLTTVQSAVNVKKALRLARADYDGATADEMTAMISDTISQHSKVRAFFQNIAHPRDTAQSAVTLDTHAWSGSFAPVNATTSKALFASSKQVGFAKTYPIVRSAMTSLAPKLAAKLGVDSLSPRQVQSITWEMTRHIYPTSGKGTILSGKGAGEYYTTPAIEAAYASGNHRQAVSLQVEAMSGPSTVRVDAYTTSEGTRVDAYTRDT